MTGNGRAGFSLIEVIVAIAILGTSIVAALGAHAAQLRSEQKAQSTVMAATLTRERLATAQMFMRPGATRLPDSLRAGSFPGVLADYDWTARIDRVRSLDLQKLTVRVVGPDADYSISTYVTAAAERGGLR